jgi:hypothetical protein
MAHRELLRSVLPLVLLATIVLAAKYGHSSAPPPSSSSEGQQIGKTLSVQRVLENRYFVSRYPQIHYYLLYFAVRVCTRRTRWIASGVAIWSTEAIRVIIIALWF